jgi:hypothetical protein
MNCRRIRDLPCWIRGAYPGRGCMGTGHGTDTGHGTAASRRLDRHRRSRSRQFGRTSAPMVPHFVHTFGPNDGTVTSPGRWSTFMITSCKHW